MEFSFPTDEETSTPVQPLDIGPAPVALPDKVYTDRAARASFALGADSPGVPVLKDQFKSGQEGQARDQAAAKADVSFRAQKLEKVQELSKSGAQLTDKDINGLMAVGETPGANPDTVFEDKFGKNWMTAGVAGDPGKNLVFQSAFEMSPEDTQKGIEQGAVLISRKQQAKQIAEEAQSAHDNLPWINITDEGKGQQDKLGNLAKNIFSGGIAQYVNQRNLYNSEPGNSFLPGNNKLEQIQSLYLLPAKEFGPALRAAAGPGSSFWKTNPSDALDFIKSAVQFSTSDAVVENTYGVMNVAGLLPFTIALRAIGRLRNPSQTVTLDAAKAAEEVLRASPKPPGTPGDAAFRTAADILAGSSKAPERGYYLPEAAVKRPWEAEPRFGELKITDGKPHYTMADGVSVEMLRTPEVGTIKVTAKDGKVSFGPTIVSKEDQQARIAMSDIVKASAEEHPQDALSKMGQHDEASRTAAVETLTRKQDQIYPINDPDAMRRSVPSFAQPSLYFNNSSSLSWRRAQELATEAEQNSTKLMGAVMNPTRVERLPQTAFDEAVKIAEGVVREKYTRLSADAIRDQVTVWDSASNLYRVETRITKPGGELFDSAAQATHYKNLQFRLGSSAEIKQEGNKFFLSHVQHVDETQSHVRDVITTGNETPRSFMSTTLSALTGKVGPSIRSAAHTVSPFQQEQRVTATHSPSVLRQAIEIEAESIKQLGSVWTKAERHELEQMLIHNRDYVPPGGSAARDRGFFYKSAGDFETAFFGKFNKMPTEKQVVAYDSYTRISDLDWNLRELEELKYKGRQGIRNYKFSADTTEGKVSTDWVNGKEVKDFSPLTTANANVYILPEQKFTTKFDLKDSSEFSKVVNDRLKSGEYKIVQMYAPREKPLKDLTGVKDDIHFVVTNKFDEKAVSFGENVPYRPGGHVIYENEHYLKQPNIGLGTNGRLTHYGDTTMKSFATENETKFWADRYETARQFLIKNDETGFQAYMSAGNLPETANEYKQMVAQGVISTDPRAPFVHTLAGRDTLQSNEHLLTSPELRGLKDTFSSYNISQNSDSAFLAERGQQLNTIKNAGTEANPLYQNTAAPLLDPYTSLQKGVGQIVRSRWMADYKISAAESWIQEFGPLFDQSKLPLDKLRQNPLYYLYHVDAVDRGVIKANPELYAAMMTARDNILRFIGAQSEVGSLMKGLELKVIQQIDTVGGARLANTAEERVIPFIKDIPTRMRSATFHLVDGMFNVVQLVQQGLAAGQAMAISPLNGMKGLSASALTRMLGGFEDAATIDKMANIASNMGWKKDHFLEALEGWKASGVSNIGGEVTMLSKIEDPKLFQSVWGKILDKGQMFFRAGDRLGRDVSWFTAYHDWRDANPSRVFDNRARTEMADRFDTLNNNMTRASNAAYNEGILSVPSQFWTWNARLTENMLGKTLSIKEKALLTAYNAAMFGLPSALGGATFGLASIALNATGLNNYIPTFSYEDMRQYAIKNNINVHDKFYSALTTGLPAMLTNAVFGKEVDFQRFGPNATQIRDITEGKKEWMEVVGGASGQMAGKFVTASIPFTMWGMSGFKQDSGYKIKWNDVLNVMENWSAFNYGERAVVANNLGKYYAKNEQFVTDVDKYETVLLGLGLTPQRVTDAYQTIDLQKHTENAQKKIEKKMIEDWRLATQAAQRGDNQTMVDYMNRVQAQSAAGGFTRKQEQEIFKKAVKGNESMVDSVNRRWLENSKEMQSIPAIKKWLENNK